MKFKVSEPTAMYVGLFLLKDTKKVLLRYTQAVKDALGKLTRCIENINQIFRSRRAKNTFSYELEFVGSRPNLRTDGGIDFLDDSGNAVFTLPAPFMYDSSAEPKFGKVEYEIKQQGRKTILDVKADKIWLSRSDIDFPVTIDPTVNLSAPNGNMYSHNLQVPVAQKLLWSCTIWGHTAWLGVANWAEHFYVYNPSGSLVVKKDKLAQGSVSYSGSIDNATPGTWQIQLWGDDQYCGGSASITYVNSIPQPNVIALNGYDKVEFSWSQVTGDAPPYTYEVRIGTDQNGSQVMAPTGVGSSTSYSRSLGNGTYWVGVRSKDNIGNYSSWTSKKVIVRPIELPTNINASSENSHSDGRLVMTWSQNEATNTPYTYETKIGTTPGGEDIKAPTSVSGTQWSWNLPFGIYYPSIRAKDSRGTYSPWWTGGPIYIQYAPPAPSWNGSPTCNDGVLQASWSSLAGVDPEKGPYTYEVRVGTSSSDDDVILCTNLGNATSFRTTLTTGTYYIGIRSRDKNGLVSNYWNTSGPFTVAAKVLQSNQYNLLNQPIKSTDARGQTVEYTYGLFGVTQEKFISNGSTSTNLSDITYQYDPIGNITKKVWVGTGNEIAYTYDEANRLMKTSYGPSSSSYIAYQYDSDNKVTAVQNRRSGAVSYTVNTLYEYDSRDRLSKVTEDIGGDLYTVAYTTSNTGDVLSIAYPNYGRIVDYTYDYQHRLKSVGDNERNYVSNIGYNTTGFLTNINYSNGTVESFTPDSRDRLNTWKLSIPGTEGYIYKQYAYNPVGDITAIDSLVPGGPFGSQSDQFSYDSYNRLAAAQVAGTSYVYDMDAADNRKGILTNGVRTDYTIESHNLLTKADGDDYTYDGRGNLVRTGTMEYEYDDENRLSTAKSNGQVVAAYWYDGNGNRVRSIEGTKTIDYIYDGLNVIQEKDVNLGTQTDYIYGMGLQQIAKVQGESVIFIHGDHLGSTSVMTDQSGNGVGTYIYEPYGQVLSHTGVDTEYKFAGKEDSSQTGLYYFGARYYDPRIGRFITQDPARDGANWYAYCENNPLNRIDPDGLMDDDIALGLFKQMATSATAAAVVVTTAQVVGQVITEKLMEFAGAVKDTASNVLKNLAGSSGSYGDPNNDDPGKNSKGTGKTKHGEQRSSERNFNDEKINDIKENYSQKVYQSGGRTVYAKKTNGYYDVVITNSEGSAITTVGGNTKSLKTWSDVVKMLNNNGGYSSLPW